MVVLPSSLQNAATNEAAAAVALDPKLRVIVRLTVRDPIFADILRGESAATGPTFETGDVPLSLQSQERLSLFDLLPTTCTVAGAVDLDGFVGAQRLRTLLTNAFLPTEGHSVSNRKGAPAQAADEALRVVGASQGGHHLSADVMLTAVTLSPVKALVILCANVLARVVEEPRLDQVTATDLAGEAVDMEVRGFDPDHLSTANLPTAGAHDQGAASSRDWGSTGVFVASVKARLELNISGSTHLLHGNMDREFFGADCPVQRRAATNSKLLKNVTHKASLKSLLLSLWLGLSLRLSR